MQTVLENNAAVSASHELAVQSMSQKTEQDMMVVMSALAAVTQSTSSLQNEMVRHSFDFENATDRNRLIITLNRPNLPIDRTN